MNESSIEPGNRPAGIPIVPGLPPFGALTLGALGVCVVSGIILLTGFEPARALPSTLAFETGRPFGWFVRNLHAWSATLAFLALLAHTADHVIRQADRSTPPLTWLALVASLPTTLYLMLGGRAMPGDAEASGISAVLHGILARLPLAGTAAASFLVGPGGADPHVLLAHHVATATLALALITVFHIRKLAPEPLSVAVALGLAGLVSLFARPSLVAVPLDGHLRGPWYMGGLRLTLEHVPVWLGGLVFPGAFLLGLAALPLLSDRGARFLRIALSVALAAYVAVTLAAVRQ